MSWPIRWASKLSVVLTHIGEPRAGAEEFRIVQPGQFFPQLGVGSDEGGFGLVDGLGAGFGCRVLGEFVHPGGCRGRRNRPTTGGFQGRMQETLARATGPVCPHEFPPSAMSGDSR